MHSLRTSLLLTRLVLAWFVLMLGVAGVSPVVHPKAMEVVCSAGGLAKIVFTGDGQTTQAGQHTFDCSICLLAAAVPPPVVNVSRPAPALLAHARGRIVAAPVTSPVGAALPARGPPSLA
jgi:hypothetical protein